MSMVVSGSPKGGRWHIIPQLAVYTTYIPLIYIAFWGVYATYHLLGEPETTIEYVYSKQDMVIPSYLQWIYITLQNDVNLHRDDA